MARWLLRRASACLVGAAALALGSVAALGACSSETSDAAASNAGDASAERAAAIPVLADAARHDGAVPEASASVDGMAPVVDAGPCNARIDVIPVAASPHVADGTPIAYASNPPSSGPHYSTWANFQELTHPVDDGYLVHSLEHGAVLLLYKCEAEGAECDALVAALRSVRDSIATDPTCDPSIRVRIIIAPRAANDVAVAAAAWGNIYRADCVDPVSLATFVSDHYAKGPEDLCVPGQVF